MFFRQLFDHESSTYTYLLADPERKLAVLIDPVRDQHKRDAGLLEELGFTLLHTLETHVHADHISGSGLMRERFGSRSVMSVHAGAGCADVLVQTGDRIAVGTYELEARLTPGHTNGCVSFVDQEGARVFTGDTLLIRGCGRTDFQQGDAGTLYDSVHRELFSLPDTFAVYPGHDYQGRTASTIGEEKRFNPRLGSGKSRAAFQETMRTLVLNKPKKIASAVPANLACGQLRPATEWAPVERVAGNVPEVTAAWVQVNRDKVRVVDVREHEEFHGDLGHIEGAELVPLGTVVDAVGSWPRDRPVVVVCRSGGRSGRAALTFEREGFERVASMRGGMILWNQLATSSTAPVEEQK